MCGLGIDYLCGMVQTLGMTKTETTKTNRRRQSPLLAQARAYYRLAAKADLAGNFRQADIYRSHADRLVERNRRNREAK